MAELVRPKKKKSKRKSSSEAPHEDGLEEELQLPDVPEDSLTDIHKDSTEVQDDEESNCKQDSDKEKLNLAEPETERNLCENPDCKNQLDTKLTSDVPSNVLKVTLTDAHRNATVSLDNEQGNQQNESNAERSNLGQEITENSIHENSELELKTEAEDSVRHEQSSTENKVEKVDSKDQEHSVKVDAAHPSSGEACKVLSDTFENLVEGPSDCVAEASNTCIDQLPNQMDNCESSNPCPADLTFSRFKDVSLDYIPSVLDGNKETQSVKEQEISDDVKDEDTVDQTKTIHTLDEAIALNKETFLSEQEIKSPIVVLDDQQPETPTTECQMMEGNKAEAVKVDNVVRIMEEPKEIAASPTPSKPGSGSGDTVRNENLYPQLEPEHHSPNAPLAEDDELFPFTEEQLRSLYYNQPLEKNHEFIDMFLQEVHQGQHEFYQIVLSYYRARNNLASSEHDVEVLKKSAATYGDLVWEIKDDTIVVQGTCQDKAKVSVEHTFKIANFDENSATNLKKSLKEIRDHIHDELSLYAYEAQLSKLLVEAYIHHLYATHPDLLNVPPNAPIQVLLPHQRPKNLNHQVSALKECISVLFMFQRKPSKEDVFVKDVREWLKMMVATLLRMATIEDHMYLINQVLRCPGGVGTWATCFIQTCQPPLDLDQSSWESPFLDHLVTLLATMLIPIKAREDLLQELKIVLTPAADSFVDNPWIMVDSDGEEDEDPGSSWHYLHENDLVALINQVPIEFIFRHVLFVSRHGDRDVYSVHRTAGEPAMLKLFAFASCLVKILAAGLQNFRVVRYRQLNKRLGHKIGQVVHYVSDHWENYRATFQATMSSTGYNRLQLEFDQLVYKATKSILSAQRLGSWQFLVNMPFSCVSLPMMWTLMWLMHQGCTGEMPSAASANVAECQAALADADNQTWFEETLTGMPTAEATYLLTTFANMARSRPAAEAAFVEGVVREIFAIAYIGRHTREFCSRAGRELLFSVCCRHPPAVSLLLHSAHRSMDKIGVVSLFLFGGLPLHIWRPTDDDTALLRSWLLDYSPASTHSQLARLVIEGMNWDLDDSKGDRLFLPSQLHHQMAVLMVDVFLKHIAGKTVSGIYTDGVSASAGSLSDEQTLLTFLWQTTLSLRLHAMAQPQPAVIGDDAVLPDLYSDERYQSVGAALGKQFSLGLAASLLLAGAGHRRDEFCVRGAAQLAALTAKQHYIPAVRIIDLVTPMFYEHDHLFSHGVFLETVAALFAVDYSRRSLVFSSAFPGAVTSLITNMAVSQIQTRPSLLGVSVGSVALFWLRLLTSLPAGGAAGPWQANRSVLYTIDSVVMVTFLHDDVRGDVCRHFAELTKELVSQGGSQSLLGSMVSWLSSASVRPTLIDGYSHPEFPWFAYAVLNAEAEWEDKSRLWTELLMCLHEDSSITVDLALKKTATKLRIENPPLAYRLSIYRWAQQAMDMAFEEPLLPVIWQRFFLRYLCHVTSDPNLPQRGSVGERFFDASSNLSMMKKMKKRLQDTVKHFEDRAKKASAAQSSSDSDDDVAVSAAVIEAARRSEDASTRRAVFYTTLLFWLDEPRLHDASLYLPALPPQYGAERLQRIFQNDPSLWLDVLPADKVTSMVSSLTAQWTEHVAPPSRPAVATRVLAADGAETSPSDRILRRLAAGGGMVGPPRLVQPRAPVPQVSDAILLDKQTLLFSLRSDFSLLVDYAKLYSVREARHVALDCTYAELLPALYSNEDTEAALSIACRSSFNPTHRCKGPAVVTARFAAIKRNDITNRKIHENRAEYNQVMIESVLPPPQNVCHAAVHVENAITNLIRLKAGTTSATTRNTCINVGITLFYHVATFISENTKYYPPTRQFFSCCIEILGQEFIRNNPSQSQPLLQAILQTPSLVQLLAPNFSPNASPDLFVSMYEDMVQVACNQGPEVAFTLLTKFDTVGWLEESRPCLSQRTQLMEAIGNALSLCGKDPQDNVKNVFEVHCLHLQQVLLYRFPDVYGACLKLLLAASKQQTLSPRCWTLFLTTLTGGGTDGAPQTQVCELGPTQLQETMEWLSSYFFCLRVSHSDSASFGLYPVWRDYATAGLAAFLRHLVARSTPTDPDLWPRVVALFAPWIEPLDNSGQTLAPWVEADAGSAGVVADAWVESVAGLQVPAVLDRVLAYYVTRLAGKATPGYVLRLLHERLLRLPWHQLAPGADTMQLLRRAVAGDDGAAYSACAREFVASVVIAVPWRSVAPRWSEDAASASTCFGCLLHVLLSLARDAAVLEQEAFVRVLREAAAGSGGEEFGWRRVDGETYGAAVDALMVDAADPAMVLARRSTPHAAVMALVKAAAGVTAETEAGGDPHAQVKQVAFVRCVVHLVCRCTHVVAAVTEDAFHPVITNTVTEVERVVSMVTDTNTQHETAVLLCRELLQLVNGVHGAAAGDVVLASLLSWVEASPASVLLRPLSLAACRAVASPPVMARLVEACFDAYFSVARADAGAADMWGWGGLLPALEVPELGRREFLAACAERGCFLTLYGHVLQTLPLSRSLDDELAVLTDLVAWTAAARPTAALEGGEAKLLLWWDKAIELSLRQVQYGGDLKALAKALLSLALATAALGEDKSSSGLLGAIGLGKKSQLSPRFRLVCKALSTYIAAQLPTDFSIRLQADSPGHVVLQKHAKDKSTAVKASQQAVQYYQHLESLKANKQYAEFKEDIEFAVNFVAISENSLREIPILFDQLVKSLFPEFHYLQIIINK